MNRQKRMLKTTAIYFVGNFASKLLAFFLLPLYTAYLTPSDFGTVDIVTSTLPLIAPVFTMQVTESIFRFLCSSNKENEINKVITNSLIIFLIGIIGFIILYGPFVYFYDFQYSNLFLIYFIFVYLGIFLQQVLRGLHKNLDYAITGVISTVIQATLNIFLITKLGYGGEALLIAAIVSSAVIALIIFIKIKFWKFVKYNLIDLKMIKKQLKYGVPLIPNQICWWVIGLLGKYILVYFKGSADNGILAVASKFPGLLTTISSIFFLAWTENIIQEFNSDDRDEYFSNSLGLFLMFSLSSAACLLPLIKIYNLETIGDKFDNAWIYIPILFIGALFNGFASFLGTAYTASMKTKEAFVTTVIGAISNLIFSLILTPFIGILGVVIANMMSFIVLFYSRIKSVRKIIAINIKWNEFVKGLSLLIVSVIGYYLGGIKVQIGNLLVLIILSILVNKDMIKGILDKFNIKRG